MAEVVSIAGYRPAQALVGSWVGKSNVTAFSRPELDLILQVYGRNVVAGRWRDYALDFAPGYASFAVIPGAHEGPAFRILKSGAKTDAQAPYSVLANDGRVLRRGADLRSVLRVFEAGLRLL